MKRSIQSSVSSSVTSWIGIPRMVNEAGNWKSEVGEDISAIQDSLKDIPHNICTSLPRKFLGLRMTALDQILSQCFIRCDLGQTLPDRFNLQRIDQHCRITCNFRQR